MGGRGVLFTVRKHACAPEGKSGRAKKKAYPVILQGGIFADNRKKF